MPNSTFTPIIPDASNWLPDPGQGTTATVTQEADGLKIYGSGYRFGSALIGKTVYDMRGADVYLKFMVNGGGTYMGAGTEIQTTAPGFGVHTATAWSFNGSTVLPQNVWLYSHYKFNDNGTWSLNYSTGNFDNQSGTSLVSYSGILSPFMYTSLQSSMIDISIGDNYGSTNAWIKVGDASTNAVATGSLTHTNPYAASANTQTTGSSGDDGMYVWNGGIPQILDGGAGNDRLYGDTWANDLRGGDGADTLLGGIGNDTLTGGTGNDVFSYFYDTAGTDTWTRTPSSNYTYNADGQGTDTITDFSAGDTVRIQGVNLSGAVTAGDGSTVGQNQAQATTAAGITTLSIGTDAVAGSDITINLTGSFAPSQFALNGTDISLLSTPVLISQTSFGSASVSDYGNAIRATSDGNFLIAGQVDDNESADASFTKIDPTGNVLWTKTYGGNQADSFSNFELTADGGYIVTGASNSYGSARSKQFLVKTDADGNQQWMGAYGGVDLASATGVAKTSDGGYILAGNTTETDAWLDYRLTKVDANGTQQWVEYFGRSSDDSAQDVLQTTDGGYLMVGYSGGWSSSVPMYIVKTDSSGTKLWDKTIGGNGGGNHWDVGSRVKELSDGSLVIAGRVFNGANSEDAALVKLDSNGNTVWIKYYGGTENDRVEDFVQLASGGFALVGSTESYGNGTKVFVITTDSDGNELGYLAFGGDTGEQYGYGIQAINSTSVAITGITQPTGATTWDALFATVSLNGIVPPSDTTPPTLSSSNPTDNDTAVVVGSNIILTMSEPVQADTGDIVISNGTDSRTIAITDTSQVTISGNTVTINPTADLLPNANYNVQMAGGVLKDLAGNAYAGIGDTTTLNFATIPPAPVNSNGQPLFHYNGHAYQLTTAEMTWTQAEAEAVAHGGHLVTVNEALENQWLVNTFTNNGNNTWIGFNDIQQEGQWLWNDGSQSSYTNWYSGEPNNSEGLENYGSIYLGFNLDPSVRGFWNDATNDSLVYGIIEYPYTGSNVDTQVPTLTSSTPADNATAVLVNTDIVLMFNEAVQAGIGDIVISNGTDTRIIPVNDSSQVSINGNTVTINPMDDLQFGSNYHLQMVAGVFKDFAGNDYAGISDATTLNFVVNGVMLTTDDDSYTGSPVAEFINALAGNDVVYSYGGNDTLVGGDDDDSLTGGAGNDSVLGDVGDDVLNGSSGNDSLIGNADDDLLNGGNGNDVLYAGAIASLAVSDGINKLLGGSGNDTLYSGSDDDVLNGGSGIDTASYALATSAVQVNLSVKTAQDTGVGEDTLAAIENLIGGSAGDTLTGNAKANVLTGDSGNDSLNGGAGADTSVFTGNTTDYSFSRDSAGYLLVTDNVANRNGVDVLNTDLEHLQFADQTVLAANLGVKRSPFSSDFNGDHKSDLLLTHSDGSIRAITLNDLVSSADAVVYNADATNNGAWQVINSKGDYDGDGKTDLLLWNSSSSSAKVAFMNGAAISSDGLIDYAQNKTGWTIADSNADYNKDGKSDVLLWNSSTSTLSIYLHNGTIALSSAQLFTGITGWAIKAAGGDYNGDGLSDILLWNQSSGSTYMTTMNGTTITSQDAVGGNLPSDWSIADAKGDYNGDGKSDILWRNSTTGELWEYQMNGTTISSSTSVATIGTAYQIVSAHNDFNADGKADILWKNTSDNSAWISLVNDNSITSSVNLGAYSGWTVQNADNDVNADGKADVLWKHSDGSIDIMEMDATTVLNQAVFGPYSGWDVWQGA